MSLSELWGKTPREVMLEEEIKQMKGELEYLRQAEKFTGRRYSRGIIETELEVYESRRDTITIPRFASIEMDDSSKFNIAVLAKTAERSGKGVGVSYYINNQDCDNHYYHAEILARMHETFILQLATYLRKMTS